MSLLTAIRGVELPAGGNVCAAPGRLMDFIALLKLRLVALVLVTSAVGFDLGYVGPLDGRFVQGLAQVILGTGLVAGGAMALNQYLERRTDGRMVRTRWRPLPAGRLDSRAALLFGGGLTLGGTICLYATASPLAAALASFAAATYLLVYTPLKTRSPICTLVGSLPGAVPPMIGYAAAAGRLDPQAWALFGILFIWQMPHCLSIAWVYREDYARGGQRVLPVVDPSGVRTAGQITLFAGLLVGASLAPAALGSTGPLYYGGALVVGLLFLVLAVLAAVFRGSLWARSLSIGSVIYLPVLLSLMILDRATP